jgi:hypothetical protein
MGNDYYPLPWATLTYDTDLGGYRTAVTEDQLQRAPKYAETEGWDWEDRARGKAVYDYYNMPWVQY